MTVVNHLLEVFIVKTKKNLALFALTSGATAVLAAYGSKPDSSQASSQNNAGSSDNFKAVMVSDTGGIDDKHSPKALGKAFKNGGKITVVKLKEMVLDYFSKAESDYTYKP